MIRLAAMSVPLVLVGGILLTGVSSSDGNPSLSTIEINDNSTAAGTYAGGVFTIELEIGTGIWYPEADDGTGVEVYAFRERGGPLQIPGPLMRVPEGTEVRATIRNPLETPLILHGWHPRPSARDDTTHLAAGESRTVTFRLDQAGTYYYWATESGTQRRAAIESQLSGAIIVDPPGERPVDRVFVMGIRDFRVDTTPGDPPPDPTVLVVNGKSWPHTERLTYVVGDSIRWHWINATRRNHPMHLHGYFFRVDSKGDWAADTNYAPNERRLAVTEELRRGQTMRMAWQPPDHPGNWIFHCHLSFHVSPDNRLTPVDHNRAGHEEQHMAGLAIGIHVVLPDGATPPQPAVAERTFRMDLQPVPGHYRSVDGMGVALQEIGIPAERNIVSIPGPPLILTRGEAVDVRVVNNLPVATSIHWHGLELESASDGVPDWSRTGMRRARPIVPGDSFTAHLTLKRPGTFVYHSHLNDIQQLVRGLYGAIVILEPGQVFDPTTDHLFVAGWADSLEYWVVNGDSVPPPTRVTPGVTNRLRMINIAPAGQRTIRLFAGNDTTATTWRVVARDGADVPIEWRRVELARVRVAVGNTVDVEFIPEAGTDYRLLFSGGLGEVEVPLVTTASQ